MVVASSALAGVPSPAKLPAAITMSADMDLVSRLCMKPPAVDGEDRFPPFAVAVGSCAVDVGPYHRGKSGGGFFAANLVHLEGGCGPGSGETNLPPSHFPFGPPKKGHGRPPPYQVIAQ